MKPEEIWSKSPKNEKPLKDRWVDLELRYVDPTYIAGCDPTGDSVKVCIMNTKRGDIEWIGEKTQEQYEELVKTMTVYFEDPNLKYDNMKKPEKVTSLRKEILDSKIHYNSIKPEDLKALISEMLEELESKSPELIDPTRFMSPQMRDQFDQEMKKFATDNPTFGKENK